MTYKSDEGKEALLIPEICVRHIAGPKTAYHWQGFIDFLTLDFNLNIAEVMKAIQDVLQYGVEKYGKKDSWQQVENAQQRYVSALYRHLVVVKTEGEDVMDDESGLYHLSHVLCNAMFLLWFEIIEDRL